MKRIDLRLFLAPAVLAANLLEAQVTFNPVPARVLGHPQTVLVTANPNLVEGRELFAPQGAAVDTTANPPILYVADTLNNRVLGWRNAADLANGAMADIVIGQRDKFSTLTLGPGSSLSGGFYYPTGVAVDGNGNLFVADSGNNRILRFPKPFSQPQDVKEPDLALGQTSLVSREANAGGRSARTLYLLTPGRLVPAQMVFDTQGNLYCSDPGNGRVLRYAAADVSSPGASFGPAADLVLGQISFSTAPQNPTSATDLTKLNAPTGLAFDPSGRLYVTDAFHRVVVWEPPHTTSGRGGQRLIGGVNTQPPTPSSLSTPEGVFFVGATPYVIDTGNSRILRYDPYESWPSPGPPQAKGVIGQEHFSDNLPNRGSSLPRTDKVSLFQPVHAVFAGGRFLVVDSQNNRILVLPNPDEDSLTELPRVLGQYSPDANTANLTEGREFSFGFNAGIAVDRNSDPPRLYVADTFNNRVLAWRDARNLRPGDKAHLVIGQPDFEKTLANYPSGQANQPSANSLFRPVGVAVDKTGKLYVVDAGNGRVLRFPAPFQTMQNHPDADLVIGKLNFTQSLQAAPDPSQRNMGEPYGVAFTVDGHLLVSDRVFNRVLFFRKPSGGDFTNGMDAEKVFGQSNYTSTGAGNLLNRLNGPRHISTDTDDRLYVCDTGNSRVSIFDRVPAAGPDPSAVITLTDVSNPFGIFVSAVTGEVWVSDTQRASWDTQSNRLRRFRKFDDLILNPNAEITLVSPAEQPVAVTLDSFGNLMTAYSTNRVAMFFPAMTPVNAANYLPRITPGMIAALYPLDQNSRRFGEQTASAATVPLPTELADVQVLVNDTPAPLFFVSPDQINFQMPMNAPTSGTVEMQAVRRSSGQILAVGCSAVRVGTKPDGTERFACTNAQVPMDVASPALFAGPTYSQGTGQIAAINVRISDGGDYGINSATNPVSRGDIIVLFGTGQGFVPNAPPDGSAPTGAVPTPDLPRVFVGTDWVSDSDVKYSGLAPYLVGVWQLNVRIPDKVAPQNSAPVVILHKSIPSGDPSSPGRIVTTIAVKQ